MLLTCRLGSECYVSMLRLCNDLFECWASGLQLHRVPLQYVGAIQDDADWSTLGVKEVILPVLCRSLLSYNVLFFSG